MKKKKQLTLKKLSLSKKTISYLDNHAANQIIGGKGFTDVYAGCLPTAGARCTIVCNTYAGCTTDGPSASYYCGTQGCPPPQTAACPTDPYGGCN